MSLAILVPVLSRPQNVKPLMDSIETATPGAEAHFICNHDDLLEIQAIKEDGRAASVGIVDGNYAQKINAGVEQLARDWKPDLYFLAADDLRFKPGWLQGVERRLREGAQVVGVNDLIPRRRPHTTHFMLTAEYAKKPCADGSQGPLYEGYEHSCVDDELIATARARGVYAYARDAHVEHLHPDVGKAEWDDTYRAGREGMSRDRRIFRKREPLWT